MEGGFDPDCRRCMPWEELDKEENQGRIREIKKLIALRRSDPACRSLYFHFPGKHAETRCVECVKLDDQGNRIQVILNCTENVVEIPEEGEILFSRGYKNSTLYKNGTLIRRI